MKTWMTLWNKLLRQHRRVTCWAFLYLVSVPAVPGQQYNRTEFTVIDGIGQGDINQISRDSLGYIWIAQLNGLSRFNGHSFTRFSSAPGDTTGLPTVEVRHIHHLDDGNAWMSTAKGLSYYDRSKKQFKTYTTQDGLHHRTVLFSYPSGDTMIVAATHFGYDLLDLRTGDVAWVRPFPEAPDSIWGHRSPNSVARPKVNPYHPHEIWSLHRNNLYVLNLKSRDIRQVTHFQLKSPPYLTNTEYLLEYEWLDPSRLLLNFFPNEGQLYIYDLISKTLQPISLSTKHSLWMNRMQRTNEDQIMCLEFSKGLQLLDMESLELTTLDSTLPRKAFTTFFREMDGTLWLGEGGIVYRYTPSPVVSYQTGEENVFLYHIADPHTGTIIAYTYTGALALVFQDGAFKSLPFAPLAQMPDNSFFHPYLNQFICLRDTRLTRFHPLHRTLATWPVKGLSQTGTISDFEPTPHGFYMAILNGVYFCDTLGQVQLVFKEDHNVEEIECYDGILYYSTIGAVKKYDLHKKQTDIIHRPGQDVYMFLKVGAARLWFGWGQGLWYLDLQPPSDVPVETAITKQFPDFHLHQVNEAGDRILASASFMMMEIDCCPPRVIKPFSYRDYIDMGYWDDAFTLLDNGYYVSTDTRKLVAFPNTLPLPELRSYQLEDVDVNGRQISSSTSSHRFRFDENNIFITSDAVYTGPPEQLMYFYRNTRNSSEWVPAKSNVFQFLDQPPGNYSIDLRVTDPYGHERIIPEAFVFEIRPPWYRSIPFYALVLVLTAFLVHVAYRSRIRQVQYKFEMQHKLQQLEVSALKAQMNPHFIFNCLNSIKGLILIGETEKAVQYIGTFSKLVRSSLDSVEEKLITLREEFDIAENYLSLERLRYGNKLTWTIRSPEETLPDRVKLPPFVLQPLIENAIIHGIKHVSHDGFIHITAFEQDHSIIIRVTDNGAGLRSSRERTQSAEHQTRKHLGLSLVERRLKLIRGTLSVKEHTDASGHIQGAISEIIIPSGHE